MDEHPQRAVDLRRWADDYERDYDEAIRNEPDVSVRGGVPVRVPSIRKRKDILGRYAKKDVDYRDVVEL